MFIILALLFGINANAQFISDPEKGDFAKFKLGEYEFEYHDVGSDYDKEKTGGGWYHFKAVDTQEARYLGNFIKAHKKEIFDKYNVVIGIVDSEGEYCKVGEVAILIHDFDTFMKFIDEKIEEKQKRTESLNTIL